MVEFIRNLFVPEKRLPYGVAALLDEEHTQIVKDIWHELDEKLDIQHPFDDPIPHITHIQAAAIEQPAFYEALDKFAHAQPPYIVRTVGLGLFTGITNALYVTVVRNPQLTTIQTNLITTLASSMEGIRETHFINNWAPHISLMIPGMGKGQLAQVVELLAERDFTWEFRVNKFIVLDGNPDSRNLPYTVELQGSSQK